MIMFGDFKDVTIFNGVNQKSYTDCFNSFPYGAADRVVSQFNRFINGNYFPMENERIHECNLTLNDIVFAKKEVGDIKYYGVVDDEYVELDLEKLIADRKVDTYKIEYYDDIYYRFFYFKDYVFDGKPVLIQSYSIQSKLNKDKDIRIVDFFIDHYYFVEPDNCNVIKKLIDSLLIEHLGKTTDIPINTRSHHDPAYIILQYEPIIVDSLIFLYNYYKIIFSMYDKHSIDKKYVFANLYGKLLDKLRDMNRYKNEEELIEDLYQECIYINSKKN